MMNDTTRTLDISAFRQRCLEWVHDQSTAVSHEGRHSYNEGVCTHCLRDKLHREQKVNEWRRPSVMMAHSKDAIEHPAVRIAELLATGAHTAVGQLRKYTGEPYIVHPRSVVERVRTVSHSPAMLCAAWLHDALDDTAAAGMNAGLIQMVLGPEVAQMVVGLSNYPFADLPNRDEKKAAYRQQLASQLSDTKTVKLADVHENYYNIVERDAAFARGYIAEGFATLAVLREGDPDMYYLARRVLEDGRAALEVLDREVRS